MSLQTNSLIVSLAISQWVARKLDKTITDEVHTNHNATSDAGRYNKLLVSKSHLEPIQQIAGRAREFHYNNTMPWGDNNERLLPTKNYFDYIGKMNELNSEFNQAVQSFLRNYDVVIGEAKVRLNGMFRDSDYPSKSQIESKFGFRTTFMPVPSNDIRVSLTDGEVDKLRLDIHSEITDRLSGAVKDIWGRVKERVGNMHERLSSEKGIFRDTLFENLKELIDLLPKLNVTDDEEIAQVCEDMKGLLVDPESVRKDSLLRSQKALEAAAILDKFKSFF